MTKSNRSFELNLEIVATIPQLNQGYQIYLADQPFKLWDIFGKIFDFFSTVIWDP